MSLVELPREHRVSIPDLHHAGNYSRSEQKPYRASLPNIHNPQQNLRLSVSGTDNESNIEEHLDDEDVIVAVAEAKTMMHSQKLAPALPAKSALRAARLLSTLPQKLEGEDRPMLPHAAPHDIYLSSEEDASSSADDFSEFDSDSESDGQKSPRRASREDIARVVSVVFSGKPSLIHLTRRSASASSVASRKGAGLSRISTEPTLSRPRSTSGTSDGNLSHPQRSSSMTPSGGFDSKPPQFLNFDPFASKDGEEETNRASKTPGSMLKRTINLMKKRNKPTMTTSNPTARTSMTLQSSPLELVGEASADVRQPHGAKPSEEKGPVSYQDIMKLAKRNAQNNETSSPTESVPPQSPRKISSGLSVGRRMSLKA